MTQLAHFQSGSYSHCLIIFVIFVGMASKYELMLSDYTPEINEEKEVLKKQRAKIYIPIAIAAVIFLSFTVSTLVLLAHYNTQSHQLSLLQQDISSIQAQINYNNYHKILLLNDTSLKAFQLTSVSTGNKKFKSINMTNHCMDGLIDLYLQDLEQLYASSDHYHQQSNLTAMIINNCYLPGLKRIQVDCFGLVTNNYFGLEEIPQFGDESVFSTNTFPNVKSIVIADKQIDSMFQNVFPILQEIRLVNTSTYNFQNAQSPFLKRVSLNDTSNKLQAFNLLNCPELQKLQIVSNNFFTMTLVNITTGISQEYLDIPRVKRLRLTNSSWRSFNRTYKQLLQLDVENDYTRDTFDISNYPKLFNVHIDSTSLKYVIHSNNETPSNMNQLQIIYSEIESLTNLKLNTKILILRLNPKMRQFTNIWAPQLVMLYLSSTVETIAHNILDKVFQFGNQYEQMRQEDLITFHNNSMLNIKSLSLANSKLSNFTLNRFQNLESLNLSNCNLSEREMLLLFETNSFKSPQSLQYLDLSSNGITDREGVKARLLSHFVNAHILF